MFFRLLILRANEKTHNQLEWGGRELACLNGIDYGIISGMTVKYTRTGFVYAFSIIFAFIAMMGEGLHTLPGMGHSCGQSSECAVLLPPDCDSGGCHGHHSTAFRYSDHASDGKNNAADCSVCNYFSLAKPCLLTAPVVGDCFCISELLPVYFFKVESRIIGSYQSRAPPFAPSQV